MDFHIRACQKQRLVDSHMRVQWIHNYYRHDIGMFMWDIYERLNSHPDCIVDEVSLPVVRTFIDLFNAFKTKLSGDTCYDVIHSQCGALVGVFSGRANGRRRIVSYRGSDIYWRFGNTKDQFTGYLRCVLSWWAGLRSDTIVVMSHAMHSKVRNWPFFAKKAIHIIPDPAGALYWPGASADIFDAILRHGWQVVIANYIHDSPIKRTRIICDAVELCESIGMPVTLNALSGQTREAVRDAIVASDVVAIASTHEGWPNIIKEAMLSGRSFVATDVSDLRNFAMAEDTNHIVSAHPLDFACAWVDQIAAKILAPHGIAPNLAQFHPDVAVLKHVLMYKYYNVDKL
jgi:hypothetical protein